MEMERREKERNRNVEVVGEEIGKVVKKKQ